MDWQEIFFAIGLLYVLVEFVRRSFKELERRMFEYNQELKDGLERLQLRMEAIDERQTEDLNTKLSNIQSRLSNIK